MTGVLSEIEERVLSYVIDKPGARGSDIGWAMWGPTTEFPQRGIGSHGHNKFCRPAGKILRRLEQLGLVRCIGYVSYSGWVAEGAARNAKKGRKEAKT